MSPIVTLTLNPAIDLTVTLDALAPGHVHRARDARRDPGGKGVNVAGCLADWGLPVVATGLLGRDNDAAFAGFLTGKGIADRFVRVPGETRTNLKLLDLGRSDTTDVNLPGIAARAEDLAAVRGALLEAAAPDGLAVLAGSLPAGLAPATYVGLTADLTARGTRVVVDASGPALAAVLAAPPGALPFAVKPNRHELEEWAGRPLADLPAVIAAAGALAERGIPLVAVSLGPDGALFVGREGVLHAHPPAMAVGSTVGAGDALVAGLVAGLQAGASLAETARLALAFAAGKLTRNGANLPDRATVRALAERIRIETLRP
ncbi:1-phosphofructokinase [Methylobacterium sp. ID0610]|uniref:1-phosphofructokinase n=1 Tax=Methylobacterium carpenticola TaxID=3344827 RepID=UPI00368425BD